MAVTTGMVGSGFYDENSGPQWAATEAVLPWLTEAAGALPLDDSLPALTIADFGCSEGRNSVEVMRRLIPAVRARSARPITTIHSDLPTNDFSGLFVRLRGTDGPTLGPNVYSAAVGGSMFDQLLPARSAHLATTFNAIGFLTRRPLDRLPGYILPNGPSALRGVGHVDAAERAAFAAQANADLERFLRMRAVELVPGGKLLVEVFGESEAGRTCDGIYDVLNDAVLEVLDAGLIDRAAYETYYQPVYFRTLDELVAPVAGDTAPLAGLFSLDEARAYEVAVSFRRDLRRDRRRRRLCPSLHRLLPRLHRAGPESRLRRQRPRRVGERGLHPRRTPRPRPPGALRLQLRERRRAVDPDERGRRLSEPPNSFVAKRAETAL